jgi:hypothetical protein
MADIVRIGSASTTPAEVIETLAVDADRMRAVVCVVLLDDGSWHVRHSTCQQSIVDSAAVNLMKFVTN